MCVSLPVGEHGWRSRQHFKVGHRQTNMDVHKHTQNPPISQNTSLPFKYFAKTNAQKIKKKGSDHFLSQAAGKRPAAFEATRAPLHYVYNCSVLKATSHVSCEAVPPCNPPVWASSPSNINANHCSQSINTGRKVQFTSDPLLKSQ